MSIRGAGPRDPFSPNARLRFDVIRRTLDAFDGSGSFLEIGCGQGAAATILATHFAYTGYEPDPVSFQTASARIGPLDDGRVINDFLPSAPDHLYDIVGAFEVLEHLEFDRAAIREWVGWLRPDGHLIVSVPAHPDRYGPSDVRVGHFRRYSRTEITSLLAEAGLVDVVTIAYGFPLGYLLEWVRNRIASREACGSSLKERGDLTARSGRFLQPSVLISPLVWVCTLPFLFVQRPFATTDLGTGWVAYGRLP